MIENSTNSKLIIHPFLYFKLKNKKDRQDYLNDVEYILQHYKINNTFPSLELELLFIPRLNSLSILIFFKDLTELNIISPILNFEKDEFFPINGIEHSLNSLKILRLVNCNLREIDKNFTYLKKLEILSLGENKIRDIRNLHNCISLKKLFLYSNFITKIEYLHDCIMLEEIDFSDNKIIKVENLDSLKYLTKLNLSGNLIENLSSIYQIKNISNLVDLKFNDVNFWGNSIIDNNDYLNYIEILKPNLKILDNIFMNTINCANDLIENHFDWRYMNFNIEISKIIRNLNDKISLSKRDAEFIKTIKDMIKDFYEVKILKFNEDNLLNYKYRDLGKGEDYDVFNSHAVLCTGMSKDFTEDDNFDTKYSKDINNYILNLDQFKDLNQLINSVCKESQTVNESNLLLSSFKKKINLVYSYLDVFEDINKFLNLFAFQLLEKIGSDYLELKILKTENIYEFLKKFFPPHYLTFFKAVPLIIVQFTHKNLIKSSEYEHENDFESYIEFCNYDVILIDEISNLNFGQILHTILDKNYLSNNKHDKKIKFYKIKEKKEILNQLEKYALVFMCSNNIIRYLIYFFDILDASEILLNGNNPNPYANIINDEKFFHDSFGIKDLFEKIDSNNNIDLEINQLEKELNFWKLENEILINEINFLFNN